jgi:hypothetical protein
VYSTGKEYTPGDDSPTTKSQDELSRVHSTYARVHSSQEELSRAHSTDARVPLSQDELSRVHSTDARVHSSQEETTSVVRESTQEEYARGSKSILQDTTQCIREGTQEEYARVHSQRLLQLLTRLLEISLQRIGNSVEYSL